MTFSVEDRQRVCLKRWARVKWQDIVESLDGKISLSSCQRIWNDFLETGSAEPLEDDRARRKDCQLTEAEQDWLARRIFDAPDLYIRELREIFVHFHPAKSWVSHYAIAQALHVRSYTCILACIYMQFIPVFFFSDQENHAQDTDKGVSTPCAVPPHLVLSIGPSIPRRPLCLGR